MPVNHTTQTDHLIGKYKATKGLYTFEVIRVYGKPTRYVQFRDKTSVPITLLSEMLLRGEIKRTT